MRSPGLIKDLIGGNYRYAFSPWRRQETAREEEENENGLDGSISNARSEQVTIRVVNI